MGSHPKPVTTPTPFSNTTTYSQIKPDDTVDTNALRDYKPQADPNIGFQNAASHARLDNSFNNPLGANTTTAIREATQRAGDQQIDQNTGQQMASSYNDQQQARLGQLSTLASLTAPRIAATNSAGFNTQVSAPAPSTLDSVIGAAGTAAGGALS